MSIKHDFKLLKFPEMDVEIERINSAFRLLDDPHRGEEYEALFLDLLVAHFSDYDSNYEFDNIIAALAQIKYWHTLVNSREVDIE